MQEGPDNPVQSETRRLAAIMFTDMVGFSRQMGANETRMLRLLEVHNQVIHQAVTNCFAGGRFDFAAPAATLSVNGLVDDTCTTCK